MQEQSAIAVRSVRQLSGLTNMKTVGDRSFLATDKATISRNKPGGLSVSSRSPYIDDVQHTPSKITHVKTLPVAVRTAHRLREPRI